MAAISDGERRRRTEAMRALSDDDRKAAIDASRNVIGFSRFTDVARQCELSEGYRRPRGGGAG